jgi:drug/metabolite transporter (DMT)-like permease
MFSLRRLPASVCGAAASLEPVYAIAFAALLFGDPVTPMILVSAALVVGALWLLLRRHNIPPP